MELKSKQFPCDLRELGNVRRFVDEICQESPAWIREELELGMDEAFANVVENNRPDTPIVLEGSLKDRKITLVLKDQGQNFDPTFASPPDFSGKTDRGFGVHIYSHVADKVTYRREGDWNHLTIQRKC